MTIVKRAGGLLPEAYPASFRLLRAGRPIAINLSAAISGDKRQNLSLLPGDQLSIGNRTNTVNVIGEVEHASLVLFEPGRSVSEYIRLAGGARLTADVSRAVVIYPSGETIQTSRHFLLPDRAPTVIAGATIRVPEKPPQAGSQFSQNLTTVTQVIATFASLALTYVALVRR
jgi:protein involved in polysaccharide export with SLBB domain